MVTRTRRRPNGLPSLDLDVILQDDDNQRSYRIDDEAFRQEGLTIGKDFFRMDGTTMTRGELWPATLDTVQADGDDVIGRGAYSTVRKAYWRRDGENTTKRTVIALKDCCCSLEDASRERRKMLVKELKALCTMQSPYLVQLYGAFLNPDVHSVIMAIEFMDLGSLQDVLDRHGGKLQDRTNAASTYQMLSGLLYLHDHRVLHRDLKPANVLLNSSGRVKLCDFGISTLLGDESMNRTVVGTTKFMAPERLRSKPYGRVSDVWSLGLIVLEVATGSVPWRGIDSLVDMVVTIEETPTTQLIADENLSFRLRELLSGCLQKDPGMYNGGHAYY